MPVGSSDVGNHCDDCTTSITLPFPVSLYGQTYTSANLSSNGTLQFATFDATFENSCLPAWSFGPTIFAHWDDLLTDTGGGIYTSVTGTQPNRTFNIEWRTTYYNGGLTANFAVQLFEAPAVSMFAINFGAIENGGSSATIGVQNEDGTHFTRALCNSSGITSGLRMDFVFESCGPATATPTGTQPTATSTITPTPIPTESTSAEIVAGDTVSTGTEASPSDPVESSVTSPVSGTVSILERTVSESATGYSFFGQEIQIVAPTAVVPDNPLVFTFLMDASLIPSGQDASTVQIFRNGALVEACTGPSGSAIPWPCVSNRVMLPDGDIEITVLTMAASNWNFGVSTNRVPRVGLIGTNTRGGPATIGSEITASVNFSNRAGTQHTARWIWGDGTTSAGIVSEASGFGSVSGRHTYNTPGIYTVTVVVTDNLGGSGSAQFQYVVIYDPNGGFVTGSGSINSPAGAYYANTTLAGQATFGFTSRYRQGAQQPDGSTRFQFHMGNLNFRSTNYDWLVISGARAQYRGSGTINGQNGYNFMLTAIDGQVNGGGGIDKFRMKIWDRASGQMVYDNQMGAGDDAQPSTAIDKGSIAIHR